MSDMEYQSGTLTSTGMSLEDFFEENYDGNAYDDAEEWLYDNHKELMRLDGVIYKITDRVTELEGCALTKNPDGTISYRAYWYNGGGSIEEVIQDRADSEGIALNEETQK